MYKNLLKNIYASLKHRLYMPSHFITYLKDLFDIRFELNENIKHFNAAVDWLKRAQDVTNDGGVSVGYSFSKGWLPSYPETTGYIILTFLNLYRFTKDEEYLQRAVRMADWLVSIQLENGAFQGGYADNVIQPVVFNTGQILLGLVGIYKQTGNDIYRKTAIKAGNWLIDIQDDDGAWRKFTYNSIPHVYHTRVAWSLLELNNVISSDTYLESAVRNINWALGNQLKNGWFKNNAFNGFSEPFLHTIAYTIRGLLESAALLNEDWLESAIKPSEVLLKRFEITGTLAGTYNSKWRSTANYSCLTGNAQIAIVWLRLFQITGDGRFLNAAMKMNDYLKALQNVTTKNNGINGAIKGSQPIWGKYQRFGYHNWSTKFFVDSVMLQEEILSNLEEKLWI